MGFLSDLIGKVKKGLDEIENAVGDAAKNENVENPQGYVIPNNDPAPAPSADYGDEWDVMPAEENQYNFGGSYVDYFTKIFGEDFPEYTVSHKNAEKGSSVIFTFTKDGATSLVCELMSESSEAKKLREDCRRAGTPYVRFYYNHQGWWNARSYVKARVEAALR